VPIYVYECASCGERFEYQQSLSEPPKTVCENCSGKLEKIIAPTAFHLKGGGWYKDLYASKKAGSAAKPAGEGTATATASASASEGSDAASRSSSDGKSAASEAKPAGDSKSAGESKPSAPSKPAAPSKASGGDK
jgi:putative FmdB family regulatory protein